MDFNLAQGKQNITSLSTFFNCSSMTRKRASVKAREIDGSLLCMFLQCRNEAGRFVTVGSTTFIRFKTTDATRTQLLTGNFAPLIAVRNQFLDPLTSSICPPT
jgi:hypothetical protein